MQNLEDDLTVVAKVERPKNKKKILMIIIIVVLALVGAIVCLLLFGDKNKNDQNSVDTSVQDKDTNKTKKAKNQEEDIDDEDKFKEESNSDGGKTNEESNSDDNQINNRQEYYCDNGYILDGTKCKKTETTNATVSNSCDEIGGVLVGEFCVFENMLPADGVCPSGYTYATAVYGACINDEDDVVDPIAYTCEIVQATNDGDWRLNGQNGCDLYNPASKIYSCPTGFTLSNTICSKTTIFDAKIK